MISRRLGRGIWDGCRRWWAWMLVPLLLLSSIVTGVTPVARAAGEPQLTVDVVAVDAITHDPITTLSATQTPRRIAFVVDFSCLTADCVNANVKIDPMALDPNYDFYRLLNQQVGFIAPAAPVEASISGTPAAGYTVSLGNVPSGSTGQFTVEYAWQAVGNVGNVPDRQDIAGPNVPDGFPITATVRGNADGTLGEDVDTSPVVTWQIDTPTPTTVTNLAAPSSGFFATDTNISYLLAARTGCMAAGTTNVVDRQCASEYTVTHQLPAGAEFVSATGTPAPTVSGDVATGLILTWDGPDWAASGNTSLVGWQAARTITITFPRENVAPPGQDCDFTVQFDGPTGELEATYLSMPGVAGEVKAANLPATGPFQLKCAEPFPRAEQRGKVSTIDGSARLEGNTVSPVVIPTGDGVNLKEWQVVVANTANIDGIAVVTDDELDQPDLPVYQIIATTGATIAWTATDGSTTQSGTSTSIATAPDGFRFVTSTVTSPRLPAPNTIEEEHFRTDFTVRYLYRVTSDAEPDGRRTNTASAVMQWPDHPEFDDIELVIPPHTVELEPPFARITTTKYADTFLANPVGSARITGQDIEVPIPADGESDRVLRWTTVVGNMGSAPAVPTVTDTHLGDNPDMPITSIRVGVRFGPLAQNQPFTAEITLDDATHVSITTPVTGYTAPSGRRIMSATVTGAVLAGANTFETGTASRQMEVYFEGLIPVDAVRGITTENTFDGSLDYGVSGLDVLTGGGVSTITLVGVKPTITAALGVPTLAGGATQATPTTNVTFPVCGTTSNVASDHVPFTPQYVFMAPAGWNITQGSASFPAGTVPAGVTFTYPTVTVGGVERQLAVATWPDGTTFGQNKTLPCMSVIARPDPTTPTGSSGVPRGFVGNTGFVDPEDIFTRPFTDTVDLDGDTDTAELFSEALQDQSVPVGAVAAMQVLKEICLPDADEADGCRWFADPDSLIGVPPNSTSIRYRVTITNTGNTTLSDAVGYDVLPYPGDTGTSAATADDARGSTMRLTVDTVTTPTNAATLTFSPSDQPCRPEVDPGLTEPACADDWSPSVAGAHALRVERAGDLTPGESFSFEYNAAVNGDPDFGAIGCNSMAVKVTGLTLVAEPSPVCATVQVSDVQIVAGTPQAQVGRPGILPWTVTNNGSAPETVGDVAFPLIPEGLEVTSFTPDGWTCTATDADGNPVFGTAVGPATLSCTSNEPLLLGVPVPLDIPVRLTTTDELTIPAHVESRMFDSDPTNNDDEMSIVGTDPEAGIEVTKTDGVATASPGNELTYTITVTNPLDFETLSGAILTDTLPAGVTFVSASDGGTLSAGVVTWPTLPDLPGAVIPGGGSVTRTVTVSVPATIAVTELDNLASVTAPDPANPDVDLTGDAHDVDTVETNPVIALDKTAEQATFDAVGDVIDYTFVVTNTGDVTLTDVTVADQLDGLTAIAYGTWPGDDGVLAPSESVTATASYTITQADIDNARLDNTAVAAGTPPAGDPVTDDDGATVTSTAVASVAIDKTADPELTDGAGQEITYTFVVTNDGPITLESVTVTDLMAGLSAIAYGTWPADDGVLAPGESVTATATYALTQADADAGSAANTATVDALTPTGTPVTDTDDALVTIPPTPLISIVKDAAYADGDTGHVGDTVDYTFTIGNDGNVTLTGIAIDDPHPGLSAITYTWPGDDGVLAPGETATATATYTVTQADVDALSGIDNLARVTGQPPTGDPVSGEDDAHVDTSDDAAIEIVKTGARRDTTAAPAAGDVVDYEFTVTNTGDLTLHHVAIADTLTGLSAITYTWPGADGVLASGAVMTATASYTLTQADIDAGQVDNHATVTGVTPTDDPVTSDDEVTVELPAAPALTLDKTVTGDGDGVSNVGETVTYHFTITNTGNVTLDGVVIDDPMDGLSEITYTWPGTAGVLAPGQSATATATYQLTSADIANGTLTNTATVMTPEGPTAGPSDDDTAVLILPPAPPVPTVPTTPPTPPPTTPDPGLPITGSSPQATVALAALTVLAGALVLALSRRRRRTI